MGGTLCMICALITPLVISLNFNSAPNGNYITFYMVLTFGLANMFITIFFALLLYILLQYPAEKVLSGIVSRHLSQDKLLEAHYNFG
jgi:hypothetical protein